MEMIQVTTILQVAAEPCLGSGIASAVQWQWQWQCSDPQRRAKTCGSGSAVQWRWKWQCTAVAMQWKASRPSCRDLTHLQRAHLPPQPAPSLSFLEPVLAVKQHRLPERLPQPVGDDESAGRGVGQRGGGAGHRVDGAQIGSPRGHFPKKKPVSQPMGYKR